MALVVPFDGSNLSKAALVRAVQFDDVLNEGILVVSVIPDNESYARERGWIEETEQFEARAIVSHLQSEVTAVAPDAEFHHIMVDRYAPVGTISNRLRRFARDHGASIVFVGSENAGRIVSGFTVGPAIAGDRAYDTMIVSHEELPKIEKLEEKHPSKNLLS